MSVGVSHGVTRMEFNPSIWDGLQYGMPASQTMAPSFDDERTWPSWSVLRVIDRDRCFCTLLTHSILNMILACVSKLMWKITKGQGENLYIQILK
jgi:hypothetical protein